MYNFSVIYLLGTFAYLMVLETSSIMLQVPLHYKYLRANYLYSHAQDSFHYKVRRRSEPLKTLPPSSGRLLGQPGQGYYITVSIGTPPQQLNVLVDTGSSNFAVAAYPDPLVNNYFHRENSTSLKMLDKTVNVPYTQGEWDGLLVEDVVSLSILPNISVRSHLACITESQGFFINASNWQGILGLAYAQIARPDSSVVPYFDSLLESSDIEDMFSMQLCGTIADSHDPKNLSMTGTLVIGGVDKTLYEGKLFTTPIYKEWYYEVVITDMEVNGDSLHMDCKEYNFDKTIVDSGTTNLRLPKKVYAEVVKRVKDNVVLPGSFTHPSNDFWEGTDTLCWNSQSVPYSSFPTLTIVLAHTHSQVFKLIVSPQQYLRLVPGVSLVDSESCYKFGISTSDSGSVLGAVIMEAFYTVFDRKNKTIGFGRSTCASKVLDVVSSSVEGYFTYKGNTTKCAYVKTSPDNKILIIVAYIMGGVCCLCILPLLILIIQCQFRQCRRRRRLKQTDEDGDERPLHEHE